jgi:hypothetical protein
LRLIWSRRLSKTAGVAWCYVDDFAIEERQKQVKSRMRAQRFYLWISPKYLIPLCYSLNSRSKFGFSFGAETSLEKRTAGSKNVPDPYSMRETIGEGTNAGIYITRKTIPLKVLSLS